MEQTNGVAIAEAVTATVRGLIPSSWSVEQAEHALARSGQTEAPLARWTISAFSGLEPIKGEMTDAARVVVTAGSEDDAMVKAILLVRRNWYRVSAVEEIDADA